MAKEEIKEKVATWKPRTPAKKPGVGTRKRVTTKNKKVETKNDDMPDKSKTRMRMKRHRPKVVNESKPVKPSTPEPKTPKRKRVTKTSVESSCKRKLGLNEDNNIVEQKDMVTYNENRIASKIFKKKRNMGKRPSLEKLIRLSNLIKENNIVEQKDVEPIRIAPKIFKKKRKMGKRLSLEKLIRLSSLMNEKLCNCESTVLNITWVDLKRRRSRTTRRHSCFLREGSQVVHADRPVAQCEHPQDILRDSSNECEHPQEGSQVVHADRPVAQCEHPQDILRDSSNECEHPQDILRDSSNELKNNVSDQERDPVREAWADFAAQKMKSLCIDDGSEGTTDVDENMKLVVSTPRVRKPKVDIDEESSRVWDLFNRGVEDTEKDKEDNSKTRLEEEREIFVGRVDSFIAAMFHFTGDRRFRRWKGSVVDSVVGVMLTPNVTDHLSSNAFMDLAAKYPSPSLREQNDSGAINYIVHEPASPQGDSDYIVCTRSNNEEYEANIEVEMDEYEANIEVEMDESFKPMVEMDELFKSMVEIDEHSSTTKPMVGRKNKKQNIKGGEENWDDLRKEYGDYSTRMRGEHNADIVDWKAVRKLTLDQLAEEIKGRGMKNQIAVRIKNFLDRLVRDHGSIDLEWLRNVPPLKAKSYLLSIPGLGLKSTECVRLLSLFQPAFPIDVNADRVLVRLGWVKLQPLPEGLQLHLLNTYPALSKVQEYIWPRICNRDEQTLYELHCYMNIFSKAFCTKTNPNCNACPMKGDCKHYASALASSRPPLEFPRAKNETSESNTTVSHEIMVINEQGYDEHVFEDHCEPVIEFPGSPEPEITEPLGEPESLIEDIEDFGGGSIIQTIILNSKEMSENYPPRFLDNNNDGTSRAIVGQDPQFAHISLPKIRNLKRLRTEHQVYELPDSHPLLTGFERRDLSDPCPYLLAIWTTDSCQEQKNESDSQRVLTAGCSSAIMQNRENDTVKGTILIPCRTANGGRFPLNGTYFQINEVFADHTSSREPIDVPREWIWNLPRLTLYCGTSITSICKGMSFEQIVYLFRRGYICIREFDLKTRKPEGLNDKFHPKDKKTAAA